MGHLKSPCSSRCVLSISFCIQRQLCIPIQVACQDAPKYKEPKSDWKTKKEVLCEGRLVISETDATQWQPISLTSFVVYQGTQRVTRERLDLDTCKIKMFSGKEIGTTLHRNFQ